MHTIVCVKWTLPMSGGKELNWHDDKLINFPFASLESNSIVIVAGFLGHPSELVTAC